MLPSKGSYFQCVSYGHITDEHDEDLAVRLTKENKVATIPVSAFYKDHTDHKILRFCFGKKDETIQKFLRNIMQDLTVTLIQTYQYWQDKEANHHHFKSPDRPDHITNRFDYTSKCGVQGSVWMQID